MTRLLLRYYLPYLLPCAPITAQCRWRSILTEPADTWIRAHVAHSHGLLNQWPAGNEFCHITLPLASCNSNYLGAAEPEGRLVSADRDSCPYNRLSTPASGLENGKYLSGRVDVVAETSRQRSSAAASVLVERRTYNTRVIRAYKYSFSYYKKAPE